jgi:hypothetical protein
MPTKMLALAVEAAEASQRECIMVFDGGGDGTDCSAARRARPNGGGSTCCGGSGIAIPAASPGTSRSTSGLIGFELRPFLQAVNT